MALTAIQTIRLLVQDTAVGMYFLSDDEIQFFLDRNDNNVNRAALEAAKVILLQLSMRSGSESVDIFSISGGNKAAEQYRMALQLFLRSPELNPVYQGISGFAGGISLSDMQTNLDNLDNNVVTTPLNPVTVYNTDPFGVNQ